MIKSICAAAAAVALVSAGTAGTAEAACFKKTASGTAGSIDGAKFQVKEKFPDPIGNIWVMDERGRMAHFERARILSRAFVPRRSHAKRLAGKS